MNCFMKSLWIAKYTTAQEAPVNERRSLYVFGSNAVTRRPGHRRTAALPSGWG
jgi:hypothetical protein